MGVVYGAGGLWNWKLFPEEEGWPEWADSKVSWREAIELTGSKYVGYLGKALKGLDITDIERHQELTEGKLCLAKPGELYIVYLPEGGNVNINGLKGKEQYKWFDPRDGEFITEGTIENPEAPLSAPAEIPVVLIIQH